MNKTKKRDAFGCVGNTIRIANGAYLDLLNPDPNLIDIGSIAIGLSRVCRYAGQCPLFYSVAEHSFLAAELALTDGVGHSVVQAIFLHDAAEAFIGDVTKPLKVLLPTYAVVEKKMEAAIAERFGVDFEQYADEIKYYDRAMLKAEKMTFWPDEKIEWAGLNEIPDYDVSIRCLSHIDANIFFQGTAKELGIDMETYVTNA